MPLDPPCRALLDALIAAGVQRARDDDARGLRDAEALANWRRLLDELTQQARILRLDRLPAAAVVGALERRCPLWPFCG